MKMAKIGVLLDEDAVSRRHRYGLNVFEGFVGEVLAHAGIPFQWIRRMEEVAAVRPDVLIAASAEDDQETAEAIYSYAAQGGIVFSFGGLRALAAKLGCRERRDIPVGYAELPGEHPHPLRFLHAVPWEQTEAGEHPAEAAGILRKERPDGPAAGALLLQFAVGQGAIVRWSVNIPSTIVYFQQGTGPVLSDGIPAEDGTGAVDEGILKADDRIAMDWEYDRLKTETGAPYFAYPYADLWKEQLIASLLRHVVQKGMTLPFLGFWPDGVPAVAHISHDSDLNLDETAETTLSVLQECGIHSTWCLIEPGYSKHIYEKALEAGHELAFHYNALDQQQGKWDPEEFDRQFQWVKEATGVEKIISNKNHYTRVEGWGELFQWCEKNGIEADQTRGPSKKGNIGFLFGTCHPYFPIAWFDEGNRQYDVLEISFLTQDLDHWNLADSSVAAPFLDQVKRVEGVAHFLFHQVHIHQQPKVTDALRKVVSEAKARGFEFWTSEQINRWERARRKVRITGLNADGEPLVEQADGLEGLAVYVPAAAASADEATEIRFGVPCRKFVLNRSKAT